MVDGMRATRSLKVQHRQGAAQTLGPSPGLRRSALMVAAAFGALTTLAQANPEGAKVVNGQATITTHGNTLVVKNSPGAIINWQSFSIGSGQVTDFIQQSVNSAILNRVVGADPSVILGTLESNGHVFLVNPNGVVFGKGATVDAAGLVVSSLNITDQDFKNGTLRFVGSDAAGDISVAGVLRSSDGDVYLIAPNVTNSGSITATNGAVVLAAGQDVEILGSGLNDIQFNVQNKGNTAINLGQINGDAVGIFAGTLTQAGGVNANTATVSGGKVVLSALGDATLASGSSTTADNAGGTAGSVSIQSAAGNISVASGANVSASGASGGTITLLAGAGSDSVSGHLAATGELTLAGSIDVLGQSVAVGGTSVIDASGATGGGQIVVGGLAKSTALLQSSNTTVDAGAVLNANATGSGDGGHVVVFGSDFMRMDGNLSAQGGAAGGNGGLIETSGEVISIGDGNIAANARVAGGKAGTWLLDPGSVDIVAAGTAITSPENGTISQVNASSIGYELAEGNNVVIQTSTVPGTTVGATISVDAPIIAGGLTNSVTLSLSAGGGIAINQPISGIPTNPGVQALSLVLAGGLDGVGTSAPITVSAPVYLAGGALSVSGESFSNAANITAASVNIAVTGAGGFVNSGSFASDAVSNQGTAGGNISVTALSGPLITGAMNVNSSGGQAGSIQLTGAAVQISGALSASDLAAGAGGTVTIQSSNSLTSTSSGSITVDGGSGPNTVGAGGTVNLSDTGGAINLSGLHISADGGNSIGTSGSSGGSGGIVSIATTGGYSIGLNNVSITANGGNGSNGSFQMGGAGGSAGLITISGGAISMNGNNFIAQGGDGGAGGPGSYTLPGYDGGGGGVGGQVTITATGAVLTDVGTTIRTQGGAGGAGGGYAGMGGPRDITAGFGGTGGYGGSILLIGDNGITLTGVNYKTIGGVGGAGGQVSAAASDDPLAVGGDGGTGGALGYISLETEVGNINLTNSSFLVLGGNGGPALDAISHSGFGGRGGDGGSSSNAQLYAFNLSAGSGNVSIDSATHITVQGGIGGVGGPGYETDTNTTGYNTQSGYGGNGGNVSGVLINATGNVSLAGVITIAGGTGGAAGNMTGTNSFGGSGVMAGGGGNGGSVGLSSTALSLSALGGNLSHTGTINIIGGGGGAGGFGADTFTLAGNGGNGGNVGEVDIFGQSSNFAGTLAIVGGPGGGVTNTNNPNATTIISGSGGSQFGSLTITGVSGLNLGGIVNLEAGASGPITGNGSAGGVGTLGTVYLSATAGAITQSGGALISTSTPLNVNASAAAISLNSPSNTIGILNASATSGPLTVVSMIDMEVQSVGGAGAITLVAANGTTGNLTIDEPISTTAGYINLSAGSKILVGGNLSAPQIDMAAGSLTLNGDVDASNLINISLGSGAILNNGQSLSAPTYILNAAGGVGSAATPLILTPVEGSATVVSGGSTGGGFYINASNDIQVGSGTAVAAVGDVQLLSGGAISNLGTITGADVNLSASIFASNFGVIDTGGALTMTAPTVVNQGSASAGSVNLLATDVDIISGSLVASGDMSISGGAVSIGFNGASTTVNAHNISIVGDSLSVSPDISGSGSSSNNGAALVSINAAGTLTITTTGDATFVAGSEAGSYVSVTSVGDSTYNIGGNLSLTGGSGAHAYALLDPTAPGSTMTINATNLGLTGGSGNGSYAAIQSVKDIIINATSGSIMLTKGSGMDADAVVVAGSGGSIVANTPSCINCVQTTGPQPIGDGVTEQGFYVATAAPVAPPAAAPPAPNQTAIDTFINDLVTLLNTPLLDQGNTDLDSTLLVDGTTDGCI